MKKRFLLVGISLLFIGILLLVGYVLRASFRQPAPYEQLSSLFPPRPLAYVQCAQLEARLKDFSQRDSYQAFLQSPLFVQIRNTAWWQGTASSWQDSLKGIAIDPFHIVGTDIALGVYQSQEEHGVPGVVVMTKIDPVVKFAERLVYLIDLVSWQIGIRQQFEVEGIPVYRIQNKEMLFPVYYSVIGELGILSNSVLLQRYALLQALGKSPPPESVLPEESQGQDPFTGIIETKKPERFVTLYGNISTLVQELQQSPLWEDQEAFDPSLLASLTALPFIQFAVDVSANALILSGELFPPSLSTEEKNASQEAIFQESTLAALVKTTSQDYPMLTAVKRTHLEPLLATLEHLFPQESWEEAWRWNAQQSLVWGDELECRLSTELFGTVYPVPDLACMLETQSPERAHAMLEYTIRSGFERLIPSAMQRRTMISTAKDAYHDFALSIWRVVFQEVLTYAVPQQTTQPKISVLATNSKPLKTLLDRLANGSALRSMTDIPPILFDSTSLPVSSESPLPVGGILIRTGRLLELLETLSQTSTFSLIFPQKRYPEFYETITALRQSDAALPDVIFLSLHVQEGVRLALYLSFWKS